MGDIGRGKRRKTQLMSSIDQGVTKNLVDEMTPEVTKSLKKDIFSFIRKKVLNKEFGSDPLFLSIIQVTLTLMKIGIYSEDNSRARAEFSNLIHNMVPILESYEHSLKGQCSEAKSGLHHKIKKSK